VGVCPNTPVLTVPGAVYRPRGLAPRLGPPIGQGRQHLRLARIRRMGRYTFPAFNKAPTPRYVVLWDLHWQVLECQRLEPAVDLSGAMAATVDRLASEGWQAEGETEYDFVFIRRDTEQRLLMLTPRDPYCA
jgi:hypothetical protein